MVAHAAHVITRLFLRTLFDFIISDLGFGSIHLILLLVHNDLRFARMQENAGPRMICTFSQQPFLKQNSLASFLKRRLKVKFLKTRRRHLGSSQLVISLHWIRAQKRRHTAKSMLLILTLSSSHKALQDGRPPHVPIILQPILYVLFPYPDHRLLHHLKRVLHHLLNPNLSFMSTTQHQLGCPGIALSLSNKFC